MAPTFHEGQSGIEVEVIYADHQNKADIAATKAREWFDTQQVDMIINLASSGAGLAITREITHWSQQIYSLYGIDPQTLLPSFAALCQRVHPDDRDNFGLPSIYGDKVQLQQVMLNLVVNAVEAMSNVVDGPRNLYINTS